jgi:putative ABC transport system permease protein
LRTLLSTFGIVLGVAGMLAISITNLTAMESITELFEGTSGKSSLIISNADTSANGFAERNIRRVSNVEGVAELIPSLQVRTVLADEAPPAEMEFNFFGTSMGGLSLYGIDPLRDTEARTYNIVAGDFLPEDNLDAYEIVLVETFAADNDIQVRDSIEIFTPNGIEKLRVAGLMAKEGPGQLNNGAFGVIPLKTAQTLFNRLDTVDQIDVVVSPEYDNSAALERLKAALQDRLGSDYSVVYPAAQGKRMTQMLGNYQIGLNFLSGIALFVGAFLIYNAFTMTVVERTREWGMLRTIGMTRRQVTGQVLGEAIVLGLVGSTLGAGLGIFMAGGLTRVMEVTLGYELGEIKIPPGSLATSMLIGVVVTLLAATLPAWQAGRISPLDALRIRGTTREGWLIKQGWKLGVVLLIISTVILILNPFPYDVQFRLGSITVFLLFFGGTLVIPVSVTFWERFSRPVMRGLYGNSGRLGSSNIQRAKLRTTLTVAALMVGVAMILVVRGMTESFKFDLEDWMEAYIGGDLYVNSSVSLSDDVQHRLEAVEGVTAVTPVRYFDVKWHRPEGDDDLLSFMAIDPASYTRVTSFVFGDSDTDPEQAVERLAAGDAIFISSVLAEKYGLQAGDSLSLRTRSGVLDFEIAGIVVDFYNQGLVIEGTWNDMRRYFRIKDANAYQVKIDEGYDVEEVQDRIETLYGKRDHLTVESNMDLKTRVLRLMDQSNSMFDVLALIAMMVAALGVVNSLTMNVMERTQEIGMLRSIGTTRWQVVKMILAEAGLMGIIGGILGLVFGIILTRVFLLAMNAMSGYQLTYVLSVRAVVVGLFIALVVSQLAAILPARRATRIDILEAIQYE